ncbi:DUF6883 domain-containing protein [Lichenibacterium ramalinae]|uniref:DUF6883 domain-containing protein n=1 Tax=Lichenibacterium ramalinae TaxID=2316527 RepID=A0A4V1RI29_9HYPH|nr:DUF6883 domain-containing protein [Lichenibacterium ramalinae]RYB02107.1 hypothetical protein D3272_22560 [Lichenibacterium ramalinae]
MAVVTHLGIDPPKVTHYLLDLTSPQGRGKATFFLARGFSRDRPEEFALALVRQAFAGWPGDSLTVPDAVKHRITGPIACPDGTKPTILTVWYIADGDTTAMLTTARPGRFKGV